MNRKVVLLAFAIVLTIGIAFWFVPLRTTEGISHLDYASKLCESGDTSPAATHYHILKGELGEYRASAKEINNFAKSVPTTDIPKCQQDRVVLSL